MRMLAKAGLASAAFMLSLITPANHSFSATIQVQSHIFFEKSLGVSNDSDISYGAMKPSANARVVISAGGEISSENGAVFSASDSSHPGKIIIDDGRAQQFGLMANGYTAGGNIRPLNALCSFDRVKSVPCNTIKSLKGPEEKVLFLGMAIQVLEEAALEKSDVPSFDLSVVYF